MKLKVFILGSIFALILSSMSPFLQTSNASSVSFSGEAKITTIDGNLTEVSYDAEGNKIEIEHVESQYELRVNTYVNGFLTDYSITPLNQENESTEIVNYILEKPIKVSSSTMSQEELNIKEVKIYKIDEMVSVTEVEVDDTILQKEIDTSSIWGTWVRSLNQGGIIGHLYKDSVTAKRSTYNFGYASGTALSVISSAITIIWNTNIVAITTLLTQLGINYLSNRLTERLVGRYEADHFIDNYTVTVNNSPVYRHTNELYSVIYYDTRNGNQHRRTVRQSNWLTEYDILVKGIQRYIYGR